MIGIISEYLLSFSEFPEFSLNVRNVYVYGLNFSEFFQA